jgi:colanic acid/amylovoran biosynthesis glycosyltransferase
MRREEHASLLITPSVAGRVLRDGRWELSRKFVVGAAAFAERWPGRVKVLMLPRDASDENLDNEVYSPGSLPFDLELGDYTPARLLREDARSSIVLGAIDYRQLDMLRHAAAAGVRVVAITEYSLKTRLQILWSEVAGTLRFARRALWQWNHERHCRAVLRMCRGVQCNGMPTFQRYRSIYPHAMLFYDNRMDVASIPSPARLQRRIESLMLGGPLRLAFSGRLARMKGVQHLPRLVWKLRKAGVDCRFDVFGDGPERNALAAEIGRLGLADVMTLHGAVSYQNRLVPHLTDHVDLFVCCHSQGDPSCTYMETLGCGVPVVGFANEAWRGMQRDLQVGWMVPSGDVAQLAEAIAKLNQHREQIAAGAQDARMTAARHAFQQTMDRRVEHLLQCLENAKPEPVLDSAPKRRPPCQP